MAQNVTVSNNDYSASQLQLMRRTIAKDTNDIEFDQFMMISRGYGLNPFRKEIYAFVFNKNDPAKRSVAFVTAIDGYRVIAERTGRYRPDEEPPRFEYDQNLKSDINPLGLVSATVAVWKQDNHGDWFKAVATAYWDEFANIKTWNNKSTLDGKWLKMPRQMLAKCAESHALRKAFPDCFSGLYTEDEMDKATTADMVASEVIHQDIAARHDALIGQTLTIQSDRGSDLEAVPIGKFFDYVMSAAKTWVDFRQVKDFTDRNKIALKNYWGSQPDDALELKRQLEAVEANLKGE